MRVQLEEYSPEWPKLFEQEKKQLEQILLNSSILIEHIGSTSIEELGAKPVIDIMIGLPDFSEAGNYIQPIVNMGYTYIPDYEDLMPYRRFFTKEKDGLRTYHIHLVQTNTEFWNRHLAFRDYLRNSKSTREAYYNLKKELALKDWKDGNEYAAAKNEFIRASEKKILTQQAYMQPAETDRLQLRPLTIDDAKQWIPFFINNPSDKFLAFNTNPLPEQATNWISWQLWRYKENRFGLQALIDKVTGNLVGMCGLLSQEVLGQPELEIGNHLLPVWWGKGLATGAAIYFKNYAFNNNLADSVISIIHVENTLSQRVAEKNEMSRTVTTTYYNMPVYIYRKINKKFNPQRNKFNSGQVNIIRTTSGKREKAREVECVVGK